MGAGGQMAAVGREALRGLRVLRGMNDEASEALASVA
jgi:hypothetical protein